MEIVRIADSKPTGVWSQRITDVLALALVAWTLMEFCRTTLGISDNVCIVVLALACVSDPLIQLVGARRRERAPRALRGTYVTAAVAAAPWIVLGRLHDAYPSSMLWQSPSLPAAIRYTGCALAFAVVLLRPLVQKDVPNGDRQLYVPAITLPSQLLMISVLLVSFSITTAALTLYWLSAAGIQQLMAASNNAQPAFEPDTLDVAA
jgi:hypothetical protein